MGEHISSIHFTTVFFCCKSGVIEIWFCLSSEFSHHDCYKIAWQLCKKSCRIDRQEWNDYKHFFHQMNWSWNGSHAKQNKKKIPQLCTLFVSYTFVRYLKNEQPCNNGTCWKNKTKQKHYLIAELGCKTTLKGKCFQENICERVWLYVMFSSILSGRRNKLPVPLNQAAISLQWSQPAASNYHHDKTPWEAFPVLMFLCAEKPPFRWMQYQGWFLCLHQANERRRYIVTLSLIG